MSVWDDVGDRAIKASVQEVLNLDNVSVVKLTQTAFSGCTLSVELGNMTQSSPNAVFDTSNLDGNVTLKATITRIVGFGSARYTAEITYN